MTETLGDRARRDADERDGEAWGYRVQLEPDERFEGRYRGEDTQTGGDYGDSPVFLFWDRDGVACYMRGHASLVRKMEAKAPGIGDSIGVARGDDYASAGGTGYSYGVVVEPNDDPLPDADDDVEW